MKKRAQKELESIRKKHNGILRAKDVVNFAKNPKTELHQKFEWNNTKAAYEYRLEQARKLIRVHVEVLQNDNRPFRAYVSLDSDRQKPGGGYRTTVDVLKHKNRREELLAEIIQELERIRVKYQHFEELNKLWSELDKVKKKKKIA